MSEQNCKKKQDVLAKLCKMVTTSLLQASQGSVDIDNLIDSSFISNVEKIENKLTKGIQNSNFTEKLEMEVFTQLANCLIENSSKIMEWTKSRKPSAVKVESAEKTPENEEEKDVDLFALEKDEFSFVPLVEVLAQ